MGKEIVILSTSMVSYDHYWLACKIFPFCLLLVHFCNICLPELPNEAHLDVLQRYFGHSSFRPIQWEIIRSVLKVINS